MSMKELTVGYAGLSKASWKTPKIEALMDTAIDSLQKQQVKLVHEKELTTTEAEAVEISDKFNREGVDLIVLHFASFPVGAVIPAIAQRVNVPIILFASPEKPEEGGIWSQNSFCGANMAAHVLNKMDKKYQFCWGKSEDIASIIAPLVKVMTCIKDLANLKLGLVGGRVPGFYTSNFDEMKLRSIFGTAVEVIDLVELINEAQNISGQDAEHGLKQVKESSSKVCAVSDEELQLSGNLFQAFMNIREKYQLDGYAVRCWPEISDIYGVAPCAVIGMLNNISLATSCEGDIYGALTMRIQQTLSNGVIPFFVDLISFDYQENTGVVWHCGAAPVSLCRNFEETTLRKHARVDGGDKKGVTNDFSIKAGRITIAKLDETANGYRMLIATGTALDTDKFIRGNPLNIKFDVCMKTLIDTIMKKGFEHHYSVVHADIKEELLSFCEIMNIEAVVVD